MCQQICTSDANEGEEVGKEHREHPARSGALMSGMMSQAQLDTANNEKVAIIQGMRVWQREFERCDQPRNVEEVPLTTANAVLHSRNNGSQAEFARKPMGRRLWWSILRSYTGL